VDKTELFCAYGRQHYQQQQHQRLRRLALAIDVAIVAEHDHDRRVADRFCESMTGLTVAELLVFLRHNHLLISRAVFD
jgi:hypothetical protein